MRQSRSTKRRSECPISFGLDIFGDQWTLLILRDILFYNRVNFKDFAPREHIATNILSERLKKLESMGFITKCRNDKLQNQYIYSPTSKSKDLLPVLLEIMLWGFQYDPDSPVSKVFLERMGRERMTVLREITQAVESGRFAVYRQEEMGISDL
jgi:DNA-binding HxlR family transcriptional regulator